MKNTLFILIALFLFNTHSFSQEVNQTKDYIYTIDKEQIYANKVTFKNRFLASDYILLDSIKYKLASIRFYKNEDGFFANTKFVNGHTRSAFAERVSKGKINLFNKEVTTYTPMGPAMGVGGGFAFGMSMPMTNTIQYYNKGFENLKRAKYKNLAVDLSDNPKSMILLNKYKKSRNTSTFLYVAGGLIAIVGTVGFISKTSNTQGKPKEDTTVNSTMMIGGVGTMLIGSFISFGNANRIEKAIDEYNR